MLVLLLQLPLQTGVRTMKPPGSRHCVECIVADGEGSELAGHGDWEAWSECSAARAVRSTFVH